MKCRYCKNTNLSKLVDLGVQPLSNSYVKHEELDKYENKYPLVVNICNLCWLIQTKDFATPLDIFKSDYAYLSSVSETWVNHARIFVKKIIESNIINSKDLIIEIGSNDGYLLQFFKSQNFECLGIEPSIDVSSYAKNKNINVINEFFTYKFSELLVKKGKKPKLIICNNVYAHVPNILDFTNGIKNLLKNDGFITIEFPHALELIKNNQFDTIYHEHFSYLSLIFVENIFNKCNLRIWRVEKLDTHGGSIRVYGCHSDCSLYIDEDSVHKTIKEEIDFGLNKIDTYLSFQSKTYNILKDLSKILTQLKNDGKSVVGYGAAAKGNTLLNSAKITNNLIEFICDAAVSKQFKYMPGSHIPIYPPEYLKDKLIDYVLILPWNLSDEIMNKLEFMKTNGTKFIIPIPYIKII